MEDRDAKIRAKADEIRCARTGVSDDLPQVWVIEPTAAADDPRWQGREIWQLAVAAHSAAFARLAAEQWARGGRRKQGSRSGPQDNFGFADAKLYVAHGLEQGVGPALDEFDAGGVMVLAGPMQSRARA